MEGRQWELWLFAHWVYHSITDISCHLKLLHQCNRTPDFILYDTRSYCHVTAKCFRMTGNLTLVSITFEFAISLFRYNSLHVPWHGYLITSLRDFKEFEEFFMFQMHDYQRIFVMIIFFNKCSLKTGTNDFDLLLALRVNELKI